MTKEGWILKKELPFLMCDKCGDVLNPTDFFYCRDFQVTFCRDCEMKAAKANKRNCNCIKKEHEHFHIIKQEIILKDDNPR